MKQATRNACEKVPELLCPAGSPLALDAAIEGGADAIYLGGTDFNARIHASNFDRQALIDGIRRAHVHGRRVYLTLNTLLYDRELPDALHAADFAQRAGADALIVADLGVAAAIHRALPELPLHASTQAGAHNAAAGEILKELGFCRMVVARELSLSQLKTAVKDAPIEIEAFIHGALCVCHSGQCLFSSLVGGRSGNRGECAQPCRLPFRTPDGRTDYPLSLKDLSLARHVPSLIDAGIASLKIEGRMRSPEYVLTVARIWRRLLDERRGANEDEMARLSEAFSRDGFTDGYFTGRVGSRMLGVRSEQDKQAGRALAPFGGLTHRVSVSLEATLTPGQPARLTISTPRATYTAQGAVVETARTAPLSEEAIRRQLTKLGNTPFEASDCRVHTGGDIMLPLSALNALRREAAQGLEQLLSGTENDVLSFDRPLPEDALCRPVGRRSTKVERSAQLLRLSQLTDAAQDYFDICYLPPEELSALSAEQLAHLCERTQLGIDLPPVIMDGEQDALCETISWLAAHGIRRALVSNIGHLPLIRQLGLIPDGGLRLGVTNTRSVTVLEGLGVERPILSPELTLPRIRDIEGDVRTVVYGRIPLMLLEKCVIREVADCHGCDAGQGELVDRRGVHFPVLRLPPHRNVVYNSLPTYMADEQTALERYAVTSWHFLFTLETPDEVDRVVQAFRQQLASPSPVRRIGKA